MGNNSVPKFIFRLFRFPVYRGSVLGRFYCIFVDLSSKSFTHIVLKTLPCQENHFSYLQKKITGFSLHYSTSPYSFLAVFSTIFNVSIFQYVLPNIILPLTFVQAKTLH